jgi:glucokinase
MAAGGHILVGDIGGTNSRLAVTACDRFKLTNIRIFEAKDFPTFEAVLTAYLREERIGDLKGASLAPAGPIEDGQFKLTNNHWPKTTSASIRATLGIEHVHLINDFEAVAHAIAHLPAADLVPIGTGVVKKGRPVMAIGPGTGLGMAYIVTAPDGRTIVQTAEPGPGSLPIQNARELAIASHVRGQGARLFNEALVSGSGLLATYQAIAALDGAPAPLVEPAQVTQAALTGSDPVAVAALDQFLIWFGRIAGDLALFLRAEGGVYLGGGIPPKILPRLLNGPFRSAFDDKTPLDRLAKAMAVFVINADMPALTGCAGAFAQAYPDLLRMS